MLGQDLNTDFRAVPTKKLPTISSPLKLLLSMKHALCYWGGATGSCSGHLLRVLHQSLMSVNDKCNNEVKLGAFTAENNPGKPHLGDLMKAV